jgi:hypothetical protein
MNTTSHLPRLFLVLALLLPASTFVHAQGSLTPSGGPAPTMRTLEQIEPRIPIFAPTNLAESGSYYLTSNLNVEAGANGLTIAANDVTVDLNGFTLRSLGGVGANGILVAGAHTNLCVRNGTIRDWSGGISAAGAANCRFERLNLLQNTGLGLWAGENSLVQDCVVGGSNANFGVLVGSSSRVKDCVVQDSPIGIGTGQGCIISGCTVRNTSNIGINAGTYSMITECAVIGPGSNGIVASVSIINRCVAGGLTGVGINVGDVGTVTDCIVQNTQGNGIQGSSGSVIRGNTLANISVNTNPAAIYVTGSGNRIEANNATFSAAYGLRATATGNVIIHNNVRNTAGGYAQIVGGNEAGPVADPATATNAWTNFGF